MTSTVNRAAAFKDCDIRGPYPEEVSDDLFEVVGAAYGADVAGGSFPGLQERMIVIGGDARETTPRLKTRLTDGLAIHPLRIIDLGARVPTPVTYWAKAELRAQASAIVTASHNPPHWNGLKVMNGDRPPRPEDIARLAAYDGEVGGQRPRAEVTSWPGATETYIGRLTETFAESGVDGLHVVIDPGNGCQSGIASRVYRALGAEVEALHDRADGRFPDRHPDCAVPENLTAVCAAVRERGADLGIAFDGDGDRLAAVDGQGRVLGSERLGMVLLPAIMEDGSSAPVVIDIKCSMALEECIEKLGGRAIRSKSGHAYMKQVVLDSGAVAGIEVSGHVFLGELDGRDDPLHTSLRLCRYLAARERSLAEMVDALPPMYMTPDIRIAMDAPEIDRLLTSAPEAFSDARIEDLDGVRIVWPTGWLLIRRSITEPKVTLRMEGQTQRDLEDISERVVGRFPELTTEVKAAVAKTVA